MHLLTPWDKVQILDVILLDSLRFLGMYSLFIAANIVLIKYRWDPVTGLGTPNFPKMLEYYLSLP
jgi:hypothetical protein